MRISYTYFFIGKMACDVPQCHLAVSSLFETPSDVLWNLIFFRHMAQGNSIWGYNCTLVTGLQSTSSLLKMTMHFIHFVLKYRKDLYFSSLLILGSIYMRPVKGTGLYRKEWMQVLITI